MKAMGSKQTKTKTNNNTEGKLFDGLTVTGTEADGSCVLLNHLIPENSNDGTCRKCV